MVRPKPLSQSSGSMSVPSVFSQTMSGSFSPSPRTTGRPSKKRLRRNVGWSCRILLTKAVNSTSGWSMASQCTQLSSESWQ